MTLLNYYTYCKECQKNVRGCKHMKKDKIRVDKEGRLDD
jgi:hypothetical protein